MKTREAVYVEYDEIQKRVCEILDIKEEQFRKYHDVIGGPYKDLWHVWLWYVDDRVHNDSMFPHLLETRQGYDDYFINSFKERFNTWTWQDAEPFFSAVKHVEEELATQTKSDTVWIEYSW